MRDSTLLTATLWAIVLIPLVVYWFTADASLCAIAFLTALCAGSAFLSMIGSRNR